MSALFRLANYSSLVANSLTIIITVLLTSGNYVPAIRGIIQSVYVVKEGAYFIVCQV